MLSIEPYVGDGKVSAIVLNWKRPDNVRRILRYLLKHDFIDEIIVWNNAAESFLHSLPDANQVIRVINSAHNLKDLAKYKAASMAKNAICFYQDDDWYTDEYLNALYRAYLLRPGVLHAATSATNWARNWNWSFYNKEKNVHAEFAWIGCGAFFPQEMAASYYAFIQREFDQTEQHMADTGFSLLQNQPIVCCQAIMRPLSQGSAYSTEPGFEQDRGELGNRVLDLLSFRAAAMIEQPRCIVRSVGPGIIVFSSHLPFLRTPQDVQYQIEGGRRFLEQSGALVSDVEIEEIVSAPFTSLFGANRDVNWRMPMKSGDVWGVMLLQERELVFRFRADTCSGEKLQLLMKTSDVEELVTISTVTEKRVHVESSVYFEVVSDSRGTLEAKIL